MITLSLLQLLEDNGFGTIDGDLFWEKLTLDKKGLYIASIGDDNDRGSLKSQRYEIYSRGSSDYEGYQKLKAVADFLNDNYELCSLPAYKHNGAGIENVTIMPLSSISNYGLDNNGRIIYSVTGRIYY